MVPGFYTDNLIVFLSFQEVQMLDLGLAQEVVRVGIQINNTVAELLEGVSTSTHRSGSYGTNLGKITLFKILNLLLS